MSPFFLSLGLQNAEANTGGCLIPLNASLDAVDLDGFDAWVPH